MSTTRAQVSTAPIFSRDSVNRVVLGGSSCLLLASLLSIDNSSHPSFAELKPPRLIRWNSGEHPTAHAINAKVWLSELESRFGLTRSGLAALIGVSRPTLYSWENGTGIRDKNAERLASLYDASKILTNAAPSGKLPALWQHQHLPGFGKSFAQGMRVGNNPVGMAIELASIWRQAAAEAINVDALLRKRV